MNQWKPFTNATRSYHPYKQDTCFGKVKPQELVVYHQIYRLESWLLSVTKWSFYFMQLVHHWCGSTSSKFLLLSLTSSSLSTSPPSSELLLLRPTNVLAFHHHLQYRNNLIWYGKIWNKKIFALLIHRFCCLQCPALKVWQQHVLNYPNLTDWSFMPNNSSLPS